ncbi:hypothetical protein ACLBWT_13795 [Paenibacillus sp. D51F]
MEEPSEPPEGMDKPSESSEEMDKPSESSEEMDKPSESSEEMDKPSGGILGFFPISLQLASVPYPPLLPSLPQKGAIPFQCFLGWGNRKNLSKSVEAHKTTPWKHAQGRLRWRFWDRDRTGLNWTEMD